MVQKLTLSNGVRILTEKIPAVRSVAVGIWVKVGSRDEAKNIAGISHFIEHMMFKGTKNRTAKDLAEALDAVGGQLNAFTSKEYTCYYAKVLDEHLGLAIDVLSDMFFNSVFDEAEIEKEKNVILEEIKMYEDTPDDQVHDLLTSQVLEKHPLGRPIIGTKESVAGLTRTDIMEYYQTHYVPKNTVVSVAGSIDSEQVQRQLEEQFAHVQGQELPRDLVELSEQGGVLNKKKDIEQFHLCLGFPSLRMDHPQSYVLHVLNSVLGGGISSRLFQTVREERGMAYSVYSYQSAYQETGMFGIYAGFSKDNLAGLLELILDQLKMLKDQGVTAKELERAKAQLKGNLFLSLENVSSRMSRIGKSELCQGKIITTDEVVERISAVSLEEVRNMANQLFRPEVLSIATIGPSEESELIKSMVDKCKL